MTDKIEYYRDKVEQYFLSLNSEELDYELYSTFLKETELDKILESKEDEDSFWEYCCKSELNSNAKEIIYDPSRGWSLTEADKEDFEFLIEQSGIKLTEITV